MWRAERKTAREASELVWFGRTNQVRMIFFFDDVAGGEEDSKEEASELVWFGPDQSGEDEFSS